MLLTITATTSTAMPTASDLGFLLHKHPDRAQSTEVFGGTAHVIWPEVSAERATAALLLEVDPVDLARGRGRGGQQVAPESFALGQYVNDRPYAASSLLSTALGKVFRTAVTGRCDARPDLVGLALPLQVHVPSLSSSGGAGLVERLFAPLGWSVDARPLPLDPHVPEWGEARVVDVRLTGELRLADALTHLCVLLPVLDDAKHYWVSADEVDRLLRLGSTWLADHPDRELITRRALRHQRSLVRDATSRLDEVDDVVPAEHDLDAPSATIKEVAHTQVAATSLIVAERGTPLAHRRREAVLEVLRDTGAASVVDLGCGEGALIRELLRDPRFTRVVGADVSARALERAARTVQTERLPDSVAARLELLQTSATYRDERLAGVDAVCLVEVVEHLDPPRLPALERSVFAHVRPRTVVVTTPNAEHNVRYPNLHVRPGLPPLRHPDHRFEWTRAELAAWADDVAARRGYTVQLVPVGDVDPDVGPPTQMAVFTRAQEVAA